MAKKAECLNFETTRTSDTLTQPVHRAFIHSVLRNRCTSKTTAQGAKIEEEIKTSLRIQWVSVRKSGWSTASLGRQNKPVMRERGQWKSFPPLFGRHPFCKELLVSNPSQKSSMEGVWWWGLPGGLVSTFALPTSAQLVLRAVPLLSM